MKPIHLRNIPPPAETFNHTEFFDLLFKWIKPENYLELGVRHGGNFTTLAKHCAKAVGVDIVPIEFNMESNMEYHQMTTDEYFKLLSDEEKFDAVFIDADHSHDQSLKDFLNVKDRVIEDGFIFFHDTYPWDWSMTNKEQCGDVWKTALHIKKELHDEFEIVTLPFNPGVTICKKIKLTKQMIYDQ
jgi:predicted O-methyltransferase YrrM